MSDHRDPDTPTAAGLATVLRLRLRQLEDQCGPEHRAALVKLKLALDAFLCERNDELQEALDRAIDLRRVLWAASREGNAAHVRYRAVPWEGEG